jgi:hypothetical protein
MPLLDELVDVLLGSTRREAAGMSDIHVKYAVKKLELGIQCQGQPHSLIHRDPINAARRGDGKHDAMAAHCVPILIPIAL